VSILPEVLEPVNTQSKIAGKGFVEQSEGFSTRGASIPVIDLLDKVRDFLSGRSQRLVALVESAIAHRPGVIEMLLPSLF